MHTKVLRRGHIIAVILANESLPTIRWPGRDSDAAQRSAAPRIHSDLFLHHLMQTETHTVHVVNLATLTDLASNNALKPLMDEVVDRECAGFHTGQVKWFNDRLGYGFITICLGTDLGRDVFVHHSGVHPINSNFRSLRTGEYTSFNLLHGHNGVQAVDVTGVGGGTLMCDILSRRSHYVRVSPSPLSFAPQSTPRMTSSRRPLL